MTNEELEREIKRLEEQIEDLINSLRIKFLESEANKKPYEVKVPEDIGDYYYVDELGEVYSIGEKLNYYDFEKAYLRGLAFKTKEEAERYDKERQLIQKMKDWAKKYNGGWKPNWKNYEEEKHIAHYKNDDNEFELYMTNYYRYFSILPCFESEEIAERFIEKFGDEIKEVLC